MNGRALGLALGFGGALMAASSVNAAEIAGGRGGLTFTAGSMSAGPSSLSVSGERDGVTWTATKTIVGVTSTNHDGTGNPIYLPDRPRLNGVAALIMQRPEGLFICTGTLLSDRRSIATAGHCVSDGAGTANPIATTAYFYDGSMGDITVGLNPAATAVTVESYYVNPEYTGEVIDQNDIAILRLSDFAPAFATSFELWEGDDLTGEDFNVAGYGRRSSVGGAVGANLGTNRLRQGDNTYDYAWGDAAFGGFFTDLDMNGENFFGTAEIDFSFVSDFDDGLAAHDTACIIASAVGAPLGFGCDLGRGEREVGIAGGDSGGPGFINNQLASVNSYGLTFGAPFGDVDNALNSSFGEFSGYVPISIHREWIAGVVPEPGTWALMIAGFGMTGAMLRRRRHAFARV